MTTTVYSVHKQNKETGKKSPVEGWGPFIDGAFAQSVIDDLNHRFPASSYFLRWKRVKTERGTYRECMEALLHATSAACNAKFFVKVSSCLELAASSGTGASRASASVPFFSKGGGL